MEILLKSRKKNARHTFTILLLCNRVNYSVHLHRMHSVSLPSFQLLILLRTFFRAPFFAAIQTFVTENIFNNMHHVPMRYFFPIIILVQNILLCLKGKEEKVEGNVKNTYEWLPQPQQTKYILKGEKKGVFRRCLKSVLFTFPQ